MTCAESAETSETDSVCLLRGQIQGFSWVMPRSAGRVRGGSKCSGSGRVGSGRVGSSPSTYGSLAGQATMTRGLFLADPRVERIRPADSPFKRTAACRRVLVVPATRGSDPRIRPAGPKMIQNLPFLDESLSLPDTPIVYYYSV